MNLQQAQEAVIRMKHLHKKLIKEDRVEFASFLSQIMSMAGCNDPFSVGVLILLDQSFQSGREYERSRYGNG